MSVAKQVSLIDDVITKIYEGMQDDRKIGGFTDANDAVNSIPVEVNLDLNIDSDNPPTLLQNIKEHHKKVLEELSP